MMRYILWFLAVIGLIIIVIILLFGHGGGGTKKTAITPETLLSYSNTSAQVRATIDGPINSNQQHNSRSKQRYL
jgi:preprotein translocase subunit SecG